MIRRFSGGAIAADIAKRSASLSAESPLAEGRMVAEALESVAVRPTGAGVATGWGVRVSRDRNTRSALTRSGLPIVATLLIVVASCGSPPFSPAPSTAPVHVSIVEFQDKRAQLVSELIPEFEAEMAARGDPVKVDLESAPMSDADFHVEIGKRYEAGNAPDVVSYPTAWAPDFTARGWLADLTDRVSTWPDWSAHVYPILQRRATDATGRIHTVPRGATAIQLFFRRDVLAAHGVSTEQPRSWDELVTRMEKARDALHRTPILIPAGTSWGGGTFDEGFINLLLGTGSPLYDDASNRWIVRSPGLHDVFALYERLTREHLLPVEPLLGPNPWEPTKYQTFVDGDLAVTTQGTWGWTFDWGPEGRRPIDDLVDRVGTWRFPRKNGGDPFVWAAESWVWTISATSRHPNEAWELIRWLSGGRPLARDLVAVGNLSPRDDMADVPPYRDERVLAMEDPLLLVGQSFTPRIHETEIQQVVGEVTQGIITGRLTADTASDEFARRAAELLGADAVIDTAASASP
jgi:multiple sugar transport system substrate-binding protein